MKPEGTERVRDNMSGKIGSCQPRCESADMRTHSSGPALPRRELHIPGCLQLLTQPGWRAVFVLPRTLDQADRVAVATCRDDEPRQRRTSGCSAAVNLRLPYALSILDELLTSSFTRFV
jgi:hypothetical protein